MKRLHLTPIFLALAGCLPAHVATDTASTGFWPELLLLLSYRFPVPACGAFTPAQFLRAGPAATFAIPSMAPVPTAFQTDPYSALTLGCQPSSATDGITTTHFRYNHTGLLTDRTADTPSSAHLDYNPENHLVETTTSCATAGLSSSMTFSRDQGNRIIVLNNTTPANCNAVGSPAQTSSMSQAFTYSSSGFPETMTLTTPTISFQVQYTRSFDAGQRLIRLDTTCITQVTQCTNNVSDVQSLTYGPNGELTTVRSAANSARDYDFSYDGQGRIAGIVKDPSGTPITTTFTMADGRLTSITSGPATYTFE